MLEKSLHFPRIAGIYSVLLPISCVYRDSTIYLVEEQK